MANVAHSTLTGSNLHENKGVASASDNTVGTASSGSTVWKKLDNTNLAALGNPFGANLFHVRDEKTSGTASQSVTSGSWITRNLTTIKTNEIASATLSANQISLPAGTYHIEAGTVMGNPAQSKVKLYNVTDSSDIIVGLNGWFDTATGASQSTLTLSGRFTLAGTKLLEIRNYVNTSTSGGSAFSAPGTIEVYADVRIWRIA